MKFTAEEWDEITDKFETAGEDDVQHSYSGRGMFGESCLGIVGNLAHFADLITAVQEVSGRDVALNLAADSRSDSLGLDTIYYFPGWTVEQD